MNILYKSYEPTTRFVLTEYCHHAAVSQLICTENFENVIKTVWLNFFYNITMLDFTETLTDWTGKKIILITAETKLHNMKYL